MNANSKMAPGIVDRNVEPILDSTEVYSGCYARVSVNFTLQSRRNRGIGCGLNNIQKLRDGDYLGGRSRAEDDFDAWRTMRILRTTWTFRLVNIMNIMSVDIETYSSVDLVRSGVYAYSASPDFEILLFGYAFGGESIEVIDLASGEELPAEVLKALTDSSVIKALIMLTLSGRV